MHYSCMATVSVKELCIAMCLMMAVVITTLLLLLLLLTVMLMMTMMTLMMNDYDGDAQWLAGANFDTENARVPMSEDDLKMSFKIVRSVNTQTNIQSNLVISNS